MRFNPTRNPNLRLCWQWFYQQWEETMFSRKIVTAFLAVATFATAAAAFTITTIDVPGAVLTAPQGINSPGDVVGVYNDTNGVAHGFLLSQGTFTTIDVPGHLQTAARGINERGDIVGQYDDGPLTGPTSSHGFVLRLGQFATIDFPGVSFTGVFGTNNQGEMAGNIIDNAGVNHGFLYQDGMFT